MIDRKRYLEMCQKNAVYRDAVKVYYNGSAFYPVSLCRIEDITEEAND